MNGTKTIIEHVSHPALTFGRLKPGDMFLHGNAKDRVYIKMISPAGTASNSVVVAGPHTAGAHGYCTDHDPVTLVKEATFIV